VRVSSIEHIGQELFDLVSPQYDTIINNGPQGTLTSMIKTTTKTYYPLINVTWTVDLSVPPKTEPTVDSCQFIQTDHYRLSVVVYMGTDVWPLFLKGQWLYIGRIADTLHQHLLTIDSTLNQVGAHNVKNYDKVISKLETTYHAIPEKIKSNSGWF